MAKLILVRHGQSEWNELGLWTGWTDIPLNEKGKQEAKSTGELLHEIKPDIAFTSNLIRAQETLIIILQVLDIHQEIQVIHAVQLNERNYGDLTGKNKWEIQKQLGMDEFLKIRRSWDHPIPHGESLKDVYNRVVPYYEKVILSHLTNGENVIVAAHGNSIRALMKYLENISDTEISNVEIATGEAHIYSINHEGKVESKEILGAHPNTV